MLPDQLEKLTEQKSRSENVVIRIDNEQRKLRLLMKEKSQAVLEEFKAKTVEGFTHSELIRMIENVNGYWKDVQRPALTALCCEAVGGDSSTVTDASLIITIVASGMGIHDDIIDKSENKHLRRTILGRYGIENALLVGDLLIIKSLFLMNEYLVKISPAVKKDLVSLALKNFLFEIYQGEISEVALVGQLDVEPAYRASILWCLVADGEACARIGAILGGGSPREIEVLADFGRRLGFIINLVEEIKDTLNQEGNLVNRLKFESVPLPVLYAAKASELAFSEIKSIIEQPTLAGVTNISKLCWKNKSMAYAYGLAKENATKALLDLGELKASKARDTLEQFTKLMLRDIRRAMDFEKKYVDLFP